MSDNIYASELFVRAEQERAAGNIDTAVYFYEEQLKRYPTDWVSCLILVDIYYNKCQEKVVEYNNDYKKCLNEGGGVYLFTQFKYKLQLAQMIMPPSELYRLEFYKSFTGKDFENMWVDANEREDSKIRRILSIPRVLYWIGIIIVILGIVLDWGDWFSIFVGIMVIITVIKLIKFIFFR